MGQGEDDDDDEVLFTYDTHCSSKGSIFYRNVLLAVKIKYVKMIYQNILMLISEHTLHLEMNCQ